MGEIYTLTQLAFGLQCGKNSLDHAYSHTLTLCPLHDVNMNMGRVVSLQFIRQEKLQVTDLS